MPDHIYKAESDEYGTLGYFRTKERAVDRVNEYIKNYTRTGKWVYDSSGKQILEYGKVCICEDCWNFYDNSYDEAVEAFKEVCAPVSPYPTDVCFVQEITITE